MKHLGYFVMLIGVLIAAFGVMQLAWAIFTSPDPNHNLVGNGLLMTVCWYTSIIVLGCGAWLAGIVQKPLV